MWVQEGNDCKENESSSYSRGRSLFSRLYSRKPKQSVTTIAIPMKMASSERFELENQFNQQNQNQNTKGINMNSSDIPDSTDQKETSISPEPESQPERGEVIQPEYISSSTPISPAQFIKNCQRTKDDETMKGNFKMDIDSMDNDDDDDIDDIDIDEIIGDADDVDDGEKEEFAMKPDDLTNLQIIGKKLTFSTVIDMNDDDDDEDEEEDENDVVFDERQFDELSNNNNDDNDVYVAKSEFDGIDIKLYSEWNECLNFSINSDGLLVIEIYSSLFGASDIMYPFIDEIIHKNGKIKFIRLNLYKLSQIEGIKQVITNYSEYKPTPIPTYIFIKNGIKMDELRGANIDQFKQIISRYSKPTTKRPQSAPIKYRSIFRSQQRPSSAQSSFQRDSNKENQARDSNNNPKEVQRIENIKNLIKNLKLDDSAPRATTKITKKSFGTTTQAIWK